MLLLLGVMMVSATIHKSSPVADGTVFADDSGSCGTNVTWSYNSTTATLTISGTGAMDDYTESQNRPYIDYIDSIQHVVIESGVTKIGKNAFCKFSALTSVAIGNNSIDIGIYSFGECMSITNVTYSKDGSGYSFDDGTLTLNNNSSVSGFGLYCNPLVLNVEWENGGSDVRTLSEETFKNCYNLESITLPSGINSIGYGCFSSCYKLSELHFLGSISQWNNVALGRYYGSLLPDTAPFYNSKAQTKNIYFGGSSEPTTTITIPSDWTSIRPLMFTGCSCITSITFESRVNDLTIGDYAFRGIGITSLVIPNNITQLNNREMFSNCNNLVSVSLPASVTSISGTFVFAYCPNLSTIVVDSNNTIYDSRDNCNAVILKGDNPKIIVGCKGTTIPNTVNTIGQSSFRGCGIVTVEINDNIQTIEQSAFEECYLLESVVIHERTSELNINHSAFGSASNKRLMTLDSIYLDKIDDWFKVNIRDIGGPAGHPFGDNAQERNLYVKNAGGSYEKVTTLVVPNSVKTIGQWLFYMCNGIKQVVLHKDITAIGNYAFSGCSGLVEIWTGSSVEAKGVSASDADGSRWKSYSNTSTNVTGTVTNNANLKGVDSNSDGVYEWVHYIRDVVEPKLVTFNSTVALDNTSPFWTRKGDSGEDLKVAYKVVANGSVYGELPTAADSATHVVWRTGENPDASNVNANTVVDLSADQTLYGDIGVFPETGIFVNIVFPSVVMLALTAAMVFVAVSNKKRKVVVKK